MRRATSTGRIESASSISSRSSTFRSAVEAILAWRSFISSIRRARCECARRSRSSSNAPARFTQSRRALKRSTYVFVTPNFRPTSTSERSRGCISRYAQNTANWRDVSFGCRDQGDGVPAELGKLGMRNLPTLRRVGHFKVEQIGGNGAWPASPALSSVERGRQLTSGHLLTSTGLAHSSSA